MEDSSKYRQQLRKVKTHLNKHEWTESLDHFLKESVTRNMFNFELVSLELNEEARKQGLNFGATHVFTNEKSRIRWSYLHLKVNIMECFNKYCRVEITWRGCEVLAGEEETHIAGNDES